MSLWLFELIALGVAVIALAADWVLAKVVNK